MLFRSENGRWLEYAGGYTDMAAQRRGAEREARRAEKPKATASSGGASAVAKTAAPAAKLSFKQKFALENLPKEIAKLEAAVAKAESEMADPALFVKNPDRFGKLAGAVERDRAALERMETEWLEIEMLRAEMEGS